MYLVLLYHQFLKQKLFKIHHFLVFDKMLTYFIPILYEIKKSENHNFMELYITKGKLFLKINL